MSPLIDLIRWCCCGLVFVAIGRAEDGPSPTGSTAEATWISLVPERLRQNRDPDVAEAFAYVAPHPGRPKVLIYGDSISIGYTGRVRRLIGERADVFRLPENGSDSGKVQGKLRKMHQAMRSPDLIDPWTFDWDVIHINVGLHDLKYLYEGQYDTRRGTQVTDLATYGENLRAIVEYLHESAPQARLIFATTTPVPPGAPGRKAGDAVRFNEAARAALAAYPEVVLNDLFAVTAPQMTGWQLSARDVHFNAAGRTGQAEAVGAAILQALAALP